MKTLYLLRHAKSSWGDRNLPDHDRSLNERGRRAAALLGRHLRAVPAPDAILASTARRVTETLELLAPAASWQIVPTSRDKALYLADPETLLAALRRCPAAADRILAVGHNPGMQEFALRLAGEVADDAAHARRQRLKDKYPTAGFAAIAFPAAESWRDVVWGAGRLDSFVAPRDLKDG